MDKLRQAVKRGDGSKEEGEEDAFIHDPVQEAGQKRQCHFQSS